MKKFSLFSIALILLGLLLFGLNWIIDGYSEPIVLFIFISFLVGVVLCFIAIAKREKEVSGSVPRWGNALLSFGGCPFF